MRSSKCPEWRRQPPAEGFPGEGAATPLASMGTKGKRRPSAFCPTFPLLAPTDTPPPSAAPGVSVSVTKPLTTPAMRSERGEISG